MASPSDEAREQAERDLATEARRWLAIGEHATLGTLSAQTESRGWPFLSIVPYALDDARRPLLLLAGIAQHTKNLVADPRASLLVCEPGAADPQAGWRVTLVGRLRRLVRGGAASAPHDLAVDDATLAAAHERYRARVPSADGYLTGEGHGFRYWRMDEVTGVRAIAGFGRMAWLDPARFVAGG